MGTRVEVGRGEDRRLRSIGLAATLDTALIAWAKNANHVTVRSLDASGSPQSAEATYDMPAARDITDIRAMGAYFVLMTHGLCVDNRYHQKCLYFRMFDRSGTPVGEVTEHRTGEWMGHPLWAQSGFTLWLAYTQLYRPSMFTRFVWSSAGTVEVETPMELAGPDGEQQPSPRALAVDETRWAVLTTNYDGERDREFVQLVLWNGQKAPLRTLTVESTFNAVGFAEENLHLLYSPRRGRPRHVVVGLDGQPRGRPNVVGRGDIPPMPNGDRLRFSLSTNGGRLEFVRSTLAKDPVGTPVRLPGTAVGAGAVVYNGQHFVAAWPAGDGGAFSIEVAPVRCQLSQERESPAQ